MPTSLVSRIPLASLIQALAVAEYLSLRQAGNMLGVVQSSISRRIKILEEELGVLLFERSTRGVRLTEAGRHFVKGVAAGIDELDHAVKAAGAFARGDLGRIHVGVYALTSGSFLDALLVSQRLGWGPTGTGLLWSCIGDGGIAGAWAGSLVARFGLDPVHWAFLALMTAGILALGSAVATPALALIGGAAFGAAYVMLTGVYLVWGVRALSDRPATELMIGFLTTAVGQAAGAPVFGLLLGGIGAEPAAMAFAALAQLAGLFQARGATSSATA